MAAFSAARIGVLAMAYGTASGPDDVERYYTDIRGGRPPAPEHLRDLKERYAAIGNRFPLLEITRRQAEALENELNDHHPGRFRVDLGMKHSPPFIAEGVARMREDGITRGVGLVLAPHWSGMSVETYVERVEKAIADGGGGPSFTFVRQWFDHPLFVEFLASRVQEARARLKERTPDEAPVVFSAHSLPVRTLEDDTRRCKHCSLCPDGCRYVAQLQATANLIAGRLGLRDYRIAWQSAGRTDDPWWGPSVNEVIEELGAAGHGAVVCCSAGFVADHLEILYDLDIEARQVAERAGMAFARTEMPNADPRFISALSAVIQEHLGFEGALVAR
jgi:protoporphyrin/coproporphyrin ferrochelatase